LGKLDEGPELPLQSTRSVLTRNSKNPLGLCRLITLIKAGRHVRSFRECRASKTGKNEEERERERERERNGKDKSKMICLLIDQHVPISKKITPKEIGKSTAINLYSTISFKQ